MEAQRRCSIILLSGNETRGLFILVYLELAGLSIALSTQFIAETTLLSDTRTRLGDTFYIFQPITPSASRRFSIF